MKKYTQTGFLILAFLLPTLLILGFYLFKTGISESPETIISGLIWLLLLVCLLIFYKLTITVDEKKLSFRFGVGWFGKSYPFSEIESCVPVKNPWWYGFGIRFTPKGWLYNVSGLKAIELRFKNKKSAVRIGTDQPEEVAKEVMRLLNED